MRNKIIQIFPNKKNQPQYKGLGMLLGWSYIIPMTSHDIIGEIRGGGVCHTGGGSVMESLPV